jgi:hypothetical protein
MKTSHTVLAVTIVAISFLLLSACVSPIDAPDPIRQQEEIAEYFKQELELIRSTVSDQHRAERLVQLVGERNRLASDHAQEIGAYRERMSVLNADYNTSRDSFDSLMTRYNGQRVAAQKEFTAMIEAMKKETTAREWGVIARFQLRRLHHRRLTYGQAS